MAVVFLAHDPRVERDVALKILTAHYQLEADLKERFEREAKIIASLEHPSIVPIYDYSEENGQPYLVMRYMSGGSLDHRILRSGEGLPINYIQVILERIGAALDVAHDAGVIHRDLKPSNILLDQYNNPFLGDFGIVKLVKRLTTNWQSSTIVGTPAYMSPEQAQGARVDRRSDIYGLGAVLYEMLTGRQPYEADSITGLLLMQVNAPVPKIRDAAPNLSNFQPVIDKAMAKSPEERFTSALELAEAFRLAMQHSRPGSLDDTLIEEPVKAEKDVILPATPISQEQDWPGGTGLPPAAPEQESTGEETETTPVVRWRSLDIDLPDENGDDEDYSSPQFSWQQLDAEPGKPARSRLRLDAALPGQVELERSFEIAVAVRQPDSPKLQEGELDKTKSGDLQVEWPHNIDSVKLRIHVSAPECEIHNQDSYSFRLHKGQDSPVFYFQLTPQEAGRIGIVVTVYQEQDWLGGTRLHTEAQERLAGKVDLNVYSRPLGVVHEAQVAVAQEIERRFNLAELRVLCHDLGVNFDNLRGEVYAEKVRELVGYMVRNGRLANLLQECRTRRQMVDWEGLAGIVAVEGD